MGSLPDPVGEARAAPVAGSGLRDRLAAMLELAAADDADGLREALAGAGDEAAELADGAGLWYGRSKLYAPRTPLMVAATYGSTAVVSLLLGLDRCVDVNRRPGVDGATALHCAASGGSRNAVAVVRLLLAAGADPTARDFSGRFPADVIQAPAPPASPDALGDLEILLGRRQAFGVATSAPSGASPSSGSQSSSSITVDRGKKEYPADPTVPDIRSSLYTSDDFRMFAFKVRPCSRAVQHDWTKCPFMHPGENARRRDPRKHPYTAVPCPNFRQPSGCARGDSCEFSHGIFETLLHPSRYRTRRCDFGAACDRDACFFAHGEDELRHVPETDDSGAAGQLPAPPLPASGGRRRGSNSGAAGAHWIQRSRLRSSYNPRDQPLSVPFSSRPQPRLSTGLSIRPTAVAQSNLKHMYAAPDMAMPPRVPSDKGHSVYTPCHKPAMLEKIHQQKGLLSPVNTSRMYSARALHPSPFGAMAAPRPRSPRTAEPTSPLSSPAGGTIAQRDMFEQFLSSLKHQLPSLGSPRSKVADSWGNMDSQMGKVVDWGVDGDELDLWRRDT